MSALLERPVAESQDYEGEESRYAIYAVGPVETRPDSVHPRHVDRRRIAETSLDGIGACLVTLREEDEITNNSRIGVLDRLTRQWVVNPWARGDL